MTIQSHITRRYSISQAAEITGVKAHTLRLWEDEFPVLRPRRGRSGIRFYVDRDLKIVGLIKRLLYEEKFSVDGARQKLRTDKALVARYLSGSGGEAEKADPSRVLAEIRRDLEALLELVEAPGRGGR